MSHTARIERARLRQQVFVYLATWIQRGQVEGVGSLNIRPDQIRRIADLKANDLVALGELSGPSIRFEVDPDALDAVLLSVEEKQNRETLIERCLRRGAPRAMMQRCFGLSKHRCAKLKSDLGLNECRGRSRRPSDAIRDEIYRLWENSKLPRTAATLLDLAGRLDISLRTVWGQLAERLD